jgi:ankyrin repeat protein
MNANRGSQDLFKAVYAGDLPLVRTLLPEGSDANVSDDEGRTLLHYAALGGPRDFREVTIRMEGGQSVMEEGRSVQDRQSLESLAEIARLLLARGARADAADPDGETPLISACSLGHEEVVRVLLEHGANVNHHDRYGRTPLLLLLTDSEGRVRAAAAKALGKLQDKSSIEPLLAALRDPSIYVRNLTCSALALFRDSRCVEPLAACLQDPEPHVQLAAALALTPWRDPRATAALVQLLVTERYSLRLRAGGGAPRPGMDTV